VPHKPPQLVYTLSKLADPSKKYCVEALSVIDRMDSLPMNELSRIYASAQDRTTKTHILQLLEKLRPTVKSTDRVLVLTLAKQVKLQDQDVFEDATVLEVAYSEKTDQLKILEGNISSKDNSVLLYRIFNIIFDEKWSASDLRILLRNFTLYSLKFSYSFKENIRAPQSFILVKSWKGP